MCFNISFPFPMEGRMMISTIFSISFLLPFFLEDIAFSFLLLLSILLPPTKNLQNWISVVFIAAACNCSAIGSWIQSYTCWYPGLLQLSFFSKTINIILSNSWQPSSLHFLFINGESVQRTKPTYHSDWTNQVAML